MVKKGLWALIILAPLTVVVVVSLAQIRVANPTPTIANTPRTNKSLLATPTSLPKDVDVVYTWVDSSDDEWRQQRNSYTNRRIRAHLQKTRAQLKTSEIRWPVLDSDLSELALSVSTVRKFLPWVRNIYVVTQRPQTIDDPSLHFVHHDELMDPANLPTFNSMAIETALHKIPGLSEHFIYLNDDFYIGQPLEVHDFFSVTGKPILFPANKLKNWAITQPWFEKRGKKDVGAMPAIANINRIMPHKVYYTNHMASPLTRSLMYETEKVYADEWAKTQSTRFRDTNNIPPVTMSLNHGYATGGVDVVGDQAVKGMMFKVSKLSKMRKARPHMFSINDVATMEQLHAVRDHVRVLISE
jgi:hypothetical protein